LIKRALPAALLILLTGGGSAVGQGVQVDLVPYAGLYVAATSLAEFSVTDPDLQIQIGQEPALLVGGRVDLWFARDFGIEGNFGYAFSNAKLEADDGSGTTNLCDDPDEDCSAYVWVAGASAIYRFLYPEGASYSIYMSAGLSVIGRGGTFWSDVDGTTDFGGTFGVGFTQDFSQRVGVRVNAEYYIYSFKLTATDEDIGTIDTDSKLQSDLVLSAALAFHLGS
jgi:hypothetical protein